MSSDLRRHRPVPRRRGSPRAAPRRARRARARRRRLVRGVGAERARGRGRRRLQRLAADAAAEPRRVRDLGGRRRRRAGRAALQVPGRPGRRHGEAEGRPVRVRGGGPAAHCVDRPSARARVARRRVGRAPARVGAAPRADVGLRGPPRLVAAEPAGGQPLADLPGAREGARRLRGRSRVHARRADADPRASVLRLVGLSGDRLLRADLPLRLAGRLPLVRRLPAPARARRDPRLGARALPARRLGARALRRHRALRARRPAPRRAPRLGHARLQLLAARSAELPARVGAVLAARVPHRRPARRRRRVDALPRLLAPRGRVGAERVRRARGPRRGRRS